MNHPVHHTGAVVVGAGQAGLSTAYHLRRLGLVPERDYVVLDHAEGPGGAWRSRWPTLTWGRLHGFFPLPGMPLPAAAPQRPAAEVLGAYFAAYEAAFALPVRRPVRARAVRPGPDDRLVVETTDGVWTASALVNATGTWDRPFWPRYPGQESFRGRQLHTAGYRGPGEFRGQRVVVVGGGVSAVQHLLELAEAGAHTTWVTRRPPRFRETPFGEREGRAAVALVEERVRQGLPPGSVVSVTGLPLTEELRRAREQGVLTRLPMFDRVMPDGVWWRSGRVVEADALLWATGFRPALDHLAPLGLREPGGGIRLDGTRAVRDSRVHLVGYGPSASTVGANRAGRTAAVAVQRLLAAAAPPPLTTAG